MFEKWHLIVAALNEALTEAHNTLHVLTSLNKRPMNETFRILLTLLPWF